MIGASTSFGIVSATTLSSKGPPWQSSSALLLHSASSLVWILGAFAAMATQCVGTSSVVLTATARNASAAKLSMVGGLATQVTTIGVAVVTHSATTTFAAQLLAGLASSSLCLLAIGPEERRAFLHPLVLRRLPPGFLRYGLSACGATLVGTLVFGRSEIFVLEANHLKVAAGVFALATSLAGQITVPMDSVMGPLLPTATRILAQTPHASDRHRNACPTRYIRVGRVHDGNRSSGRLPGNSACIQPSI